MGATPVAVGTASKTTKVIGNSLLTTIPKLTVDTKQVVRSKGKSSGRFSQTFSRHAGSSKLKSESTDIDRVPGVYSFSDNVLKDAISNPDEKLVTLWHTTSTKAAQEIRLNGINLDLRRPTADFGKGIYLTSNLGQALKHATRFFDDKYEILKFNIRRANLAGLKGLSFDKGTDAFIS